MTEVVKIQAAPAWLAKYAKEDESLKPLQEHRRFPILQVVQGLSDEALKAIGPEGTVVLQPGGEKIAAPGSPFLAVPIYMFRRFQKRADRKDVSSPKILDETLDEKSELARLCMNKATWEEHYGEGGRWTAKNMASFNFVFVLVDNDLNPTRNAPVALSFSSGSYGLGQDHCGAMTLRGGVLWAQVWELYTKGFKNQQGTWQRVYMRAPVEAAWTIREDQAEFFQSAHEQTKKYHKDRLIGVEDVDAIDDDDARRASVVNAEDREEM